MNSLKHSKSDIISAALIGTSMCHMQRIDIRKRIDTLFSDIGDGLEHVHTDDRRSIYEYNGSDFSVQSFEVHSANVPLGNHFHIKSEGHQESNRNDLGKLSEMFVFDEGKGLLLLQDVDSEGKVIGKIKEFSIRAGDILVIPPFRAHTLFLDPKTKFRGFRPYRFDPDNMDMNPHKLELPK